MSERKRIINVDVHGKNFLLENTGYSYKIVLGHSHVLGVKTLNEACEAAIVRYSLCDRDADILRSKCDENADAMRHRKSHEPITLADLAYNRSKNQAVLANICCA